MPYFINYDANDGTILGFYHVDVHDVIPEPNIAVNEAEWRKCVESNGGYKVDIDTQTLIKITPP